MRLARSDTLNVHGTSVQFDEFLDQCKSNTGTLVRPADTLDSMEPLADEINIGSCEPVSSAARIKCRRHAWDADTRILHGEHGV